MISRERAWISVFLIAANVIFISVMIGLTMIFKWFGPGFAAGAICGYCLFFTYFKIKHGYWP